MALANITNNILTDSGTSLSSLATQTYVTTAISNLVASAPATLDTLNELAIALGNDANFATTVATSIGTKQPQLSGTGFIKIIGTTISYDNSTYQPLLTNPVTGTGNASYLLKFTGTSTIGNSAIYDNSGKILIGTVNLTSGHNLTVYSATETAQFRAAGAAPAILFTNTDTNTNSYSGYVGIVTSANNFMAGSTAGDMVVQNYSGYRILFGVGNVIKMQLAASGQLILSSTISNGTYTYTLPSATGTLALTSQIPSFATYVPYTGATANIDLGNFNITASGTSSFNAVTLTSNLWLKNTGTYDFVISNGASLTTNTVRVYYTTSDELRFYGKNTAGVSVVPKIMVGDGTTFTQLLPLTGGTLTGALSVNGGTVNLATYTSSEARIADSSIHLMKTSAAGIFEAVRAMNADTTAGTTVRLVAAATSDPFNNTNGGKVFIDAVRTSTNMDLVFSLNDVAGAAPVERVRFTGGGNLIATGTISASNYSGTHSGSSSGTNTGDQTNISGNAATASNASALGGYTQDFQTVVGTGDYLIIRNQAANKLSLASWASVQSGLGLGSLAYSSATIPTNTNQLTNGAGYITGISSGNVTTALGYTPWNYGGVDAGRNIGASTNLNTDLESGGAYGSYGAGGTSWNAPFSYGAVIAFAFTSGIKAQFGFDIRHNQSDYGDLRYRTKNNLGYSTWRTMWHSGNLTNNNQLTNGAGYITSSGSITGSAGSAGQVTHNSGRTDGTYYNVGWFAGASSPAYSCDAVQIQSSTGTLKATSINAPSGYVSNGNPWGTANSAYFPNGITTAGSDNWIYGHTYIGNAPSNGSGHEFWSDGHSFHRSNLGTSYQGASARFVELQSANGNFIPYSFESDRGNHSWGTVARFRINNGESDRPSIQFSWGGSDNRWNVGYCAADDNFRITQNMGYRNDNSTTDGWGSERFKIDTSGNITAGGSIRTSTYLYASGNVRVGDMWSGNGLYVPSGIMVFGTENEGWRFSMAADQKAYIGTDGNIWMKWAGAYISTLLDNKQNASSAINTGNIGSQSVSYASSAGSAGSVSGLTLTSSANGINPDSVTQNQLGYNNSVSLFGQADGGLYSSAYSSAWIHQIYGDFRTGQIAIRGKLSGTWQGWRIVLDSGNYTSYVPSLSATNTWTGAQNNFVGNGNTGSTNNVGLVVYSTGGNGAQMSFHRSGAYAINMGLDSDNVFRIGGWSASANRLQLDMSGNLTVAGSMYANGNRVVENSGTWSINVTGSAGSAGSASYAGYLPTLYAGGVQSNPQVYFNNGIGLRVAMTGSWSTWSDTLWINGYSGGDVPNMCALHFLRNGTPRMAISTQSFSSSSYGSYYEFITEYNIGSQSVSYATTSGTANAVAWGNVSSKPANWLNTTNLIDDNAPVNAVPSGFYQNYNGSGNPTGTWFNYINVRHSNPGNGHGFQIGMSYYDTNLWFRSYQGGLSPTYSAWSYAISSLNIASQSVSYAATAGSASANLLLTGGTLSGTLNFAQPVGLGFANGQYVKDNGNGGFVIYGAALIQLNSNTQTSGPVVIGGNFSNNAYNSVGSTRLMFGGGNSDADENYYIGTNFNNYGGNYTKLELRWHTGIRMGAQPGYGGIRMYNTEDLNTVIFSVGETDNHVRGYYDIIAYASDKRLKHNIQPIENALSKVKSLTGMTYQWNEVGKQYGWEPDTEIREVGVFAQDVQVVLPEAVRPAPFDHELGKSKSGENFLTVKYEKMVPLLIEAIKEQQTQIESQKSEIDVLKDLVQQLINR